MNLSGRGSTDAAISFINALSEGVKQRRIYQFDIAQQKLKRRQAREDAQDRLINELRLQTVENMVEAGEPPGIGSGGLGGGVPGAVAPGVAAPGAVIPGLENLVGSQQPTTPPTTRDILIQSYQKYADSLRMKKVAGDKEKEEEQLRKQISGIVDPILIKHPELAKMYFDAGGVNHFVENRQDIGPFLTYLSNYDQAKERQTAEDEADIELEKDIKAEGRQRKGDRKASEHKVFMEKVEEHPDLFRYVDDDGNITDRKAFIEHYKVLEGQVETVPLSFFGTPGKPSEGHYQDEIRTKAMDLVNNEWARITLKTKEWDDPDYNKFVQKLFEDVSTLIVNSVRSAVGDAIQKAKVAGTITKAQRTVLLREQKNPDNVHIKNIIRLLKKAYGRLLAKNESVEKQALFMEYWDSLW